VHQAQLIVGAFPQRRSSRARLLELNEVSFPLLDERRCSISRGVPQEEDFFKHSWASKLVEVQAPARAR
jgi:hypothetical protein